MPSIPKKTGKERTRAANLAWSEKNNADCRSKKSPGIYLRTVELREKWDSISPSLRSEIASDGLERLIENLNS